MSGANGYWGRLTSARVSRRRALGAGGLASGVLAISLAGCGGSGAGKTASTAKSGLVALPVDTTAQARSGGVLKHFQAQDVSHFDASISNATSVVNPASIFAYPRLLKFNLGRYPKIADGGSVGDAAESYEVSGDKLQVTLKLRQAMKWDARAPTSGRALDAQDVVFSWNKFARLNPAATDLVYSAGSPTAPVESVSSPDSGTVVLKLKQPDSTVIPLLTAWDHFYVMPRESDSGFDPKQEVRGHGPWLLESYQPSVGVIWRKNPDYYVKGRPFPDRIESPLIVDHSQQLAQFKTGSIHTNVVTNEDVVQTKKDVPQAMMQAGQRFASAGNYISFGYEGDSPFKDTRVRQALSLALDRQGYADSIENRAGFEREGLELPIAYNSVVWAGWTGYWLDPASDKEFGESSKYLKLNLAEGKKLMAAAGYANGIEFDFYYSSERYGAEFLRNADVFAGMFRDAGMKPRQAPITYEKYQSEINGAYFYKDYIAGKAVGYSGAVLRAGRSWAAIASQLFGTLHKDGSVFHGLTPDGKNAHLGDPKVNDLVEKVKAEFDLARQQTLVHDLVRYYTQQAYSISRPTTSKPYTLAWPAIGNYGVDSTYNAGNVVTETMINWWIDGSNPPLGRAQRPGGLRWRFV